MVSSSSEHPGGLGGQGPDSQGALPFYFVQLAPFRYGNPSHLPVLWEAQNRVPTQLANVAINDVGDVADIHPRDKRTVGVRLANLALNRTYRMRSIQDQGPRFVRLTRESQSLRILFDHARGLTTRDGEAVTHFEIAGLAGDFVRAQVD